MTLVTAEIYKMPVLFFLLAIVLVRLDASDIGAWRIPLQPNKAIASGIVREQRYLIWNEWTFLIDRVDFVSFQQRIDQAKVARLNAVRFNFYWPVF